jgi:hypothetical protein
MHCVVQRNTQLQFNLVNAPVSTMSNKLFTMILAFAQLESMAGAPLSDLQKFFMDYLNLHHVTQPTFVLTDDDHSFVGIELAQIMQTLSVLYTDAKLENTSERLQYLKQKKNSDVMFFVGSGHRKLLQRLSKKDRRFFTGITYIVQNDPSLRLTLRLDTNMFSFESEGAAEGFLMYEHYGIKGGDTITRMIGKWSREVGLTVHNPVIWERRSDLFGTILTNSIVDYEGVAQIKYNSQGKIVGTTGCLSDILDVLIDYLNFTTLTVTPRDGQFGSPTPSGGWTGVVGQLGDGEADLSTTGLTYTLCRVDAVDFTIPYEFQESTLLGLATSDNAVNMWVYLDIFSLGAWIILILSTFALFLGFMSTSFLSSHTADYEHFTLAKSLAIPTMLLLQFSCPIKASTLTTRILLFLSASSAYLLFSYYSCDLTARMTMGPTQSPINSFRDVLDRGYTVLIYVGSSNEELLATALKGTSMKEYYDLRMKNRPKEEYHYGVLVEGLEKIVNNPKTLIFAVASTAERDSRVVALKISDSVKGQGRDSLILLNHLVLCNLRSDGSTMSQQAAIQLH